MSRRIPKNTKRNTETWLAVLNLWLKETGRTCDLKTVSAQALASLLEHAYAEIRKQDFSEYSQSSLMCFRSAIHRELTAHNRQMNIFKDVEFSKANQILNGVIVQQKRDCIAQPTKHKPAITEDDMLRLDMYFKAYDSDPIILREYVWFIVTYHFCLRSSEVQAMITKKDLCVKKSANGSEYICLENEYISKNHQGTTSTVTDGRIVDSTQVKVVQLLLNKLSPTSERIFRMPKKNVKTTDSTWYCGKPVGKNKLAEVMKSLSTKACLSRVYTNHSVRATCITAMTNKQIPDHVIARTSGH